ncbi:hypothetical protein M5689_000149 [Euphorbia peplus]|nr:hypothetical protein M5689_000149 [Euphorbia peplus]
MCLSIGSSDRVATCCDLVYAKTRKFGTAVKASFYQEQPKPSHSPPFPVNPPPPPAKPSMESDDYFSCPNGNR